VTEILTPTALILMWDKSQSGASLGKKSLKYVGKPVLADAFVRW
jgi:hypothetical protein